MRKFKFLHILVILLMFLCMMSCAQTTSPSETNKSQSVISSTTNKIRIDNIWFESEEYEYTGSEYSLQIKGELPNGVSVEYTNNSQKEVGEYLVTATFNDSTGKYIVPEPKTATLTIRAKGLDAYLNSKTVTYNGEMHYLELEDNLPEGVTVEYENNGHTDVGNYEVIAKIKDSTGHYNVPQMIKGYLNIVPASIEGISFSDQTFIYDGQKHSVFVEGDLPEGVQVTYTNNDQTELGRYDVVASISDSKGNYKPFKLTARLKIETKIGFSIEDDIAVVIDYFDDDEVVAIPSKVSRGSITYPVKKIGENAFEDATTINSVIIPDSVEVIEKNAFVGCTNLKEVYISKYVTEIQNGAFTSCSNLSKIDVDPDNAIYDSRNNCNAIIETESNKIIVGCYNTTIEESITDIAGYSFASCHAIVIPETIQKIEFGAFYGCDIITSITIPFIGDCKDSENASFAYIFGHEILHIVDSEGNVERTIYGAPSSLKKVVVASSEDIMSYAFNYCGYIEEIIISGNIERIENNAFDDCNSLKTISMPETLSYIGENAFAYCYSLAEIDIPDNVSYIGNYAFNNCSQLIEISLPNGLLSINEGLVAFCHNLRTVNIPNSIRTICDYAFSDCYNLLSITIPANVTSIDEYSFSDNYRLKFIYNLSSVDMSKLSLPDVDAIYTSLDDMISFETDSNGFIFYTLDENNYLIDYEGEESEISLPTSYNNQTYEIAPYAFYYIDLIEKVSIPNNIDIIPNSAFYGCSNISSVTMSNSVEIIDDHAFFACIGLKEITLSSAISSIGYNAFYACNVLERVNFNGKLEDWCNINFVYGAANPMYYTLGFYLQNDINEWVEIKDLELPESITKVKGYAFYGLKSLTSVKGGENVETIGSSAFSECLNLTTYEMGNKVEVIEEYAFNGCVKLNSISFSNNLSYVGTDAFDSCESIPSTIYNDEVYIGDENNPYLILHSTNSTDISQVYVHDNCKILYNDALNSCTNLIDISLPNNLLQIGERAFYGCSSIKDITVPTKVQNIGRSAFYGCASLEKMSLPFIGESKNSEYTFIGFIFGDYYVSNESVPSTLKEVIVTDSLYIPASAFSYCVSIETIKIISNINSIKSSAFSGCSSLKTVEISETSELKYIGGWAFVGCTSLESFEIPSTVDIIYPSTFRGCTSLVDISIPQGVEIIGESAFAGCTALTNVEIPNSVYSIEKYIFEGCTKLESISIPFVGTYDVLGTNQSIYEDYIESYDSHFCTLFSSSSSGIPSSLKNITVNGGSLMIFAFYGANDIENVVLDENVVISEDAASIFTNCTSLKKVEFKQDFSKIGSSMFSGCTSLKEVIFSDTVQIIGYRAFYNCSSLENINLINVHTIDSEAFYNCTSLRNIIISSDIDNIGYNALPTALSLNKYDTGYYAGNDTNPYLVLVKTDDNISEIEISNQCKVIYASLKNNTSITSIVIPDSVVCINGNAFYGCTNLSTVTISSKLKYLGSYSFYQTPMVSITLPNTLVEIGDFVFMYDSNLEEFKFNGTIAEWDKVKKATYWAGYSSIVEIICLDGTASRNG